MVGSDIFWNGIGCGFSGEQSVSPIWMSAMPEIATIRAHGSAFHFHLVQSVKFIKLADFYFFIDVRVVVVDQVLSMGPKRLVLTLAIRN